MVNASHSLETECRRPGALHADVLLQLRQAATSRAVVAAATAWTVSRLPLAAVGLIAAIARRKSPIDVWNQWDSVWYLRIAGQGFGWHHHLQSSLAFFPFFPLLVHLGARTGLPAIAVGLLLSNVAFFGALFYLHLIFTEHWGTEIADRALLLVALFPTALFTGAPYTESLFLLSAAAAVFYAEKQQPLVTGLWLGAAVLTRPTGAILILPVLLLLKPRRVSSLALTLVPSAIGWVAYLWYLSAHHVTLRALLSAQRGWHRALSVPWSGFAQCFNWLLHHGLDYIPWTLENLLGLAVTVLALMVTALLWRDLSVPMRIYCGLFWIPVLCTPEWLDNFYAPFNSVPRFVLALFPLAPPLAARLSHRSFWRVLVLFTALLISGTGMYLAGGWVA